MAQKPNRLSVRWSRAQEHGVSRMNNEVGDVVYEWGPGCKKADGAYLHWALGCERMQFAFGADKRTPYEYVPSLLAELHARGYDLTTLKFSIKKRPVGGEAK